MDRDTLVIHDHLNRYCHAVDRGTADDVANLFHADGAMVPVFQGAPAVVGRDTIRAWYAEFNKVFQSDQVKYMRHRISSPIVDVDGDTATACCYFDAEYLMVGEPAPKTIVGRYDDTLVKENGRWTFTERQIIGYYEYARTGYTELPAQAEAAQ